MNNPPLHLQFENAAGQLYLEPGGYVCLIWCQTAASRHVRVLLNQALHLLVTSGCGRMLIDHRQAAPYSEEDCAWLLTNWFPRCMRRTQYGYGAIVASYELFVRLAVSSFGQRMRRQFGVHYHYFEANEEDDAVTWLLAQPYPPRPASSKSPAVSSWQLARKR